jgi:hypothetical protein
LVAVFASSCHIYVYTLFVLSLGYRFGNIATNGLALGAVADFGAQNCQYTTKVDARQNVRLTTLPAIEPNACYAQITYNHLVHQ